MKCKFLLLLAIVGLQSYAGAQRFSLGSAQNFAVLGSSTVTSTGPTAINGQLGVSPGSSVTGFPPGTVTVGPIHRADPTAGQAQKDLNTSYNALSALPPTHELTGQNLGGLTLTPGIYHFNTSAQLTGTLTLDFQNDPDALFVFQIGSTLTTAPNASVLVVNGGDACNVYWKIGSSATLGIGTAFKGNILAYASITVSAGATIVSGRALAENGAVTLDNNQVSIAGCPHTNGPAGTFACLEIRFDFNIDGNADLLFQSQSKGSVSYETMNGVTPASNGILFPNVSLAFKVVGAPDLNGDGKPDVLFQSISNGSVAYALMNGLAPSGQYGYLFRTVPAGFVVAGTPDINGDGHPDIVFQKQSTGDISYVYLNGVTPGASGYLFRNLDPNLKLVGTADLNGDGHPDLLFQNNKTGDVTYTLMNGTVPLSPTSHGTLFSNVSLDYKIVGTPDLNGDCFEDIVFQNQKTGDVSYILLYNLTVIGNGYLFRGLNLDQKIVGVR